MTGIGPTPNWNALATLYELASLVFLPPTSDVAQAMADGEFADALEEALDRAFPLQPDQSERPACPDDITAASDLKVYRGTGVDDLFHRLRREHTRLFVGTGKPPVTPYAGVRWSAERGMPGLLFVGPESVAIEHAMREAGAVHAASAPNEPLDHIGTMCEFLSYLCLINAGSVAVPEGARVESGTYGQFHDEHFSPFAHWLAGQVGELSDEPLFLVGAQLLCILADDGTIA